MHLDLERMLGAMLVLGLKFLSFIDRCCTTRSVTSPLNPIVRCDIAISAASVAMAYAG